MFRLGSFKRVRALGREEIHHPDSLGDVFVERVEYPFAGCCLIKSLRLFGNRLGITLEKRVS